MATEMREATSSKLPHHHPSPSIPQIPSTSSHSLLPLLDPSSYNDQLSEAEDPFTSEQHAEQDAPLLEMWKDCEKVFSISPHFVATLLQQIVLSGDPSMKAEFRNIGRCISFCHNNLQIRAALIRAVAEGSFKSIRRLAILHKLPETLPSIVSDGVVIDAWRLKFLGDSHKLLLNNINAMERNEIHSNTVPIIQSSGTGKSRMVDEQAKLVFTIPFNLRGNTNKSGFAFPLPDASIRKYLLDDVTSKVGNDAKVSMMQFWISLFKEINTIVAGWHHTRNQTHTSLALRWYQHLSAGDHRSELYECVVRNARDSQTHQRSASTWNELVIAACEKLSLLIATIESHVIKSVEDKDKVKVMIYFDEAHVLADTTLMNVYWESSPSESQSDNPTPSTSANSDVPRPWTLYDMAMWCFSCFQPRSAIFALFLSTTSRFSQLAPTINVVQAAGDKSCLEKVLLQPPITELPFDACPELGIQDGHITFFELRNIQFLARFGRTLFWAYMNSMKLSRNVSGPETETLEDRLLALAMTKLVQKRKHFYALSDTTERTALLDIRLMFNYQPNRERARKMQEDLVASHLRCVYSVPEHREYIRSGYSSEPLLVEASAQIMHTIQQSNPSFMVNTLREIMELDIIDLGERGEIIGRALLMKAYDDAVRTEQPSSNSPNFSAGCRVINFIESLFVSSVSELILNSIPSNCGNTKFKEAFKNARMRLTHFVRLDDDTLLCPSGMFVGFVRGMAFICQVGEFSIDFAIPIAMLKDDNEPISQHSMTTLFLQIKRRIKEGPTNAYQIDEEKIQFFPRGKAGPQLFPYITLVMELGILPAGVVATSYKNPVGVDKSTAVLSKVSEGTGKSNRKGKGKSKDKGKATPVPKDDNNVTSRKRKISQREVTPEASTSKRGRHDNDASDPGIPHTPKSKKSADGVITFHGTPSKVRVIQHGQLHHPPIAHPCYSIFAYGCSNTVYKVIRQDERAGYAALLANRTLLMEHPRQDVASITYVRRMKYRWNWHDDTCHWVYFTEVPFAITDVAPSEA